METKKSTTQENFDGKRNQNQRKALDSKKTGPTQNQLKTIEALRKMGQKGANRRLEILKKSKAILEEEKQTPTIKKSTPPPKSFKATLPLTISKESKQLIADLKKKGISKLQLEKGLEKGGQLFYINKLNKKIDLGIIKSSSLLLKSKVKRDKNIGFTLEKTIDKDELNIKINFPKKLKGLRIPIQKHQGDYQYRMREIMREDDDKSDSKNSSVEGMVNNIMNPKRNGEVLNLDDIQLDNVAWYDFSDSRYILEPEHIKFHSFNFSSLVGSSIKTAIKMEEEEEVDSTDYLWFEEQLINAIYQGIYKACHISNFSYDPETGIATASGGSEYQFGNVVQKIIDVLTPDFYGDLCEIYYSINYQNEGKEYWSKKYFFQIIANCWAIPDYQHPPTFYHVIGTSETWDYKLLPLWNKAKENLLRSFNDVEPIIEVGPLDEFVFKPDPMPSKYSFDPFFPMSYNLGLRLVYRQEWRSLGNQRGEIVRTIPLAPKQIEKVSTKIVKRSKISKNTELTTSEESTTESNDTTKDSSELIKEASSTFGWNVEAELSQGWIGGGMKVSGGTDSSTENQSKESSTRLSETMQKLATKTRTESKVIVSTESETTYEETTSSEIQNPNEEIPITCVYSKLQRQYEIFTSLAEVQEVIMVAERVPRPEEINYKWVKKYDWIIAKALLDDSFSDALNSISQDSLTPEQTGMTEDLKGILNTTVSHLGSLASESRTSELSISGVDMVQESQKNYLDASVQRAQRQRQNYLLETKRDRLYKHIYENILHYCRAIWSNEDPQQRVLRYRKQEIKIPTVWEFHETDENGEIVKIWDLDTLYKSETIDDNPNDEIRLKVNGKFVHTDDYAYLSDVINPAGPIGYFGNYALYYMKPEYATDDVLNIFNILKLPYVYFAGTKNENGEMEYDYDNPVLMDPVLKKFKDDQVANPVQDEIIRIKQDEMIKYVPELRLAYHQAKYKAKHPKSDADKKAVANFLKNYQLFREHYPEYKYREDLSRRFLVDTNNLVMDILPGEGSALEGFKLAHRGVDVLKAIEEKEKMRLENQRRKKLIKSGKLGDPDIDKVVLVSETNELAALVASADVSESNKSSVETD